MNKEDLFKAALMLLVIAAEYWAMQPYHEPLLAKLYSVLAKLCYSIARRFGAYGLSFEFAYYESVGV